MSFRLDVPFSPLLRPLSYFDSIRNVTTLYRVHWVLTYLEITLLWIDLAFFYKIWIRSYNERFPKYLLDWIPTHGSRSVVCPRHNLLKTIEDDLEMFLGDGCDLELVKCCAADRSKWRHLLKSATSSLSSREQADSSSDDWRPHQGSRFKVIVVVLIFYRSCN